MQFFPLTKCVQNFVAINPNIFLSLYVREYCSILREYDLLLQRNIILILAGVGSLERRWPLLVTLQVFTVISL